MAAQKGKDLLLKLDDGTGTFITIAGLRTRRLSLNADTVDASSAESVGRWRELLAGAGLLRASIAGTGIFKDAASDVLIRQNFFNGTVGNWQMVVCETQKLAGLSEVRWILGDFLFRRSKNNI